MTEQILFSGVHRYIFESLFRLNNITVDSNGDFKLLETGSIDMIIPCYVGVHCYNFLLHKYGLTPGLFGHLANQTNGVYKVTKSSYGHDNNIWLKDYNSVGAIAGHFNWQVWLHLDTYVQQFMTPVINPIKMTANDAHVLTDSSYEYTPPDAIPPPKCMVIGRHPIDRFISYYYQRCHNIYVCLGMYLLLK